MLAESEFIILLKKVGERDNPRHSYPSLHISWGSFKKENTLLYVYITD